MSSVIETITTSSAYTFCISSIKQNKFRSIVIGISAVCIYDLLKKVITKKLLRLPPGPIGLPFLGNSLDWAKNQTPFLQNLATTFGPVSSFYMMGSPWVVVSNAKIQKEVLSQYNPRDRVPASISQIQFYLFESDDGTPSIVGTRGPQWKRRRKLAQSTLIALSTSKVMTESLNDSIFKVLFPYLNKEKHINADILTYLAFNTIFYISMGKSIGINDDICKQLMQLTNDTFRVAAQKVVSVRFPSFKWVPSIKNALIEDREIIGKRCDIIRTVINERKKQLLDKPKCYIDYTIQFVNDGKMTESEQIADIFAFFAAGMDTTGKTLHFGVTLAAKHQSIQSKVRNELFEIMGSKFDLKKVNKCILFRAFIFEVIRIASPARMTNIRLATKTINIGKYCIPKGVKFFTNLEYINRVSGNEQWEHKNEYDGIEICLDNWLYIDKSDNVQRFKMNDSFRAFSSGKRNCIGQHVAIKQVMIIMGSMIMNYRLMFKEDQNIDEVNKSLNDKTLRMVRDVFPAVQVQCEQLSKQ